jgi:polyhydroxyalkanoate synthesis regulator phasin
MRKTIAALAVTAGVAGGALIGAPVLSAAAPRDPKPSDAPAAAPAPSADREGWAKQALSDLVAKGTISQAQADAVLAALKEARPGHPRLRAVVRRHAIEVSADAMGMTPRELRAELQKGQSIAQVAQAKGVDLKTVTDALTAEATTRIAKLVTDGKLTQAQADKLLAALPERITAFVNKVHPGDLTP